MPGGAAAPADIDEAGRRCKKELKALAKCQRAQAKKGNPTADKCFVECLNSAQWFFHHWSTLHY